MQYNATYYVTDGEDEMNHTPESVQAVEKTKLDWLDRSDQLIIPQACIAVNR